MLKLKSKQLIQNKIVSYSFHCLAGDVDSCTPMGTNLFCKINYVCFHSYRLGVLTRF